MKKGVFISIEGNEGSGKSTITEFVLSYLKEKNIKTIKTREPGGSPIAEVIRDLILNYNLDPLTEAYAFAASRREHLKDVVLPFLEKGTVVLCDRFVDSSIAYQGYARGVGVDKVIQINSLAVGNDYPDLTLVLDLEPEIGLKRISFSKQREVNRLDNESLEFHRKCREGYKKLPAIFPERTFVFIDASKPLDKVQKQVLESIKKHFNLW